MKTQTRQRQKMGIVLLLAALVLGFSSLAFAADQILSIEGYGIGTTIGGGACGQVSSDDFPLCEGHGANFLVQRVSGTGLWQHIGTVDWVADFIFDSTAATPLPNGDLCFKAYGESRHVMGSGVITMAVAVDLCTSGQDIVFDGTYNITDGEGQFAEAAGFGSISGGLDENAMRMLVNIDGTLIRGSGPQ